jgi:hypothetical protein
VNIHPFCNSLSADAKNKLVDFSMVAGPQIKGKLGSKNAASLRGKVSAGGATSEWLRQD